MKTYTDVINDLNGGMIADTLTAVLSEAASRVHTHGKAGEVSLILKLKPVKGAIATPQILIEAVSKHKMPTIKGDKSETSADETLMYISAKGDLSIIPEVAVELPCMNTNP